MSNVLLLNDAIYFAVLAYVYAVVLTDDGELLSGWYKWLQRKADRRKAECEPQINEAWWFKPVIGCEKCVAGQLALWVYPIRYWIWYDVFDHLFIIASSILLTIILKLTIQWLTQKAGF